MVDGQNLLSGKKVGAATEFVCVNTRIFVRHLIAQTNCVVNGHGPQFSSDSTPGTAHGKTNQHGAGHSDNRMDSSFRDAVMMSSTSSIKVDILVLFNSCIYKSFWVNTPLSLCYT